MKPTILDRVVGYISPESGRRRIKARMATELGLRSYEAATKGRRFGNWSTPGTSANAAMAGSLQSIRNRSRDLKRNNPYAARGLQGITSNTVGTGIIPTPISENPGAVAAASALWKAWGESVACDAEFKMNFYGIQAAVLDTVAESGSCLVRRRYRRTADGLPVPLQLQVLEPDFLDTTRDMILGGGGRIIQGVEFDRRGRRVAYWLYPEHPGENAVSLKGFTSQRVPASEVLHIFRSQRPGQVDGVPWLAPVMMRLRDLDEYEDAQLVKQKVSACFVGFVHDIEASDDLTNNTTQRELMERVEPGMLDLLPPGKSVTFGSPPPVTGYDDHTRSVLRSIAAGLGVTYEVLTGDYSNVNFSSGRMGWIEFHRNIDLWRWQMLIPQLCEQVWQWLVEAAVISGALPAPVGVKWTAPRREMINPIDETNALKTQVRCGFTSLSEAIRQQGDDPEATFAEIAEDYKRLDALKIIVDTDVRQRTNIGYNPGDQAGEKSSSEAS